ncbi:MAG: PD-(D/E)XK nuclease family protein [Oscillospiraceae bacterium]
MLTIITGRAGSGKTSRIFEAAAALTREKSGGNIIIVPEQYSHDAERALAGLCGDSVSLYAEVLSFTRLGSRVFAQTGGMADKTLDNGGRVLAMSLAAASTAPRLKVYNVGSRRPDFLKNLISAYDELRSACAGSGELAAASGRAEGSFKEKLEDLALIFETYDLIKEKSGCDARDRLERLAQNIGKSDIGDSGKIFIDGFTDFTAQEFRVIEELLKKDADITVCLTCGSLNDDEQVFRLPVKTVQALLAAASKYGVKARLEHMPVRRGGKSPELEFLERHLMDYGSADFDGEAENISVYAARSISEECETAAARVLELVRSGCRFRDIAVVSPKWESYDSIARGVFKRFGVPIGLTEKSDILEKPIMALVISALDIINDNWDYVNVFKYLKTDLAGISAEERDVLENYVLKWSIRGESSWNRSEGWRMPPSGYSEELTDKERAELELINALRLRVVTPIIKLHRALNSGESALSKVQAVYEFMEDVNLYETLSRRSKELRTLGNGELADEYSQLWDIVVGALQQFADVLGETPVGLEEFLRLIKLVLSQYQVGVIPATVDSVRGGDMARVRTRGIKHLIVMGATDDALPAQSGGGGIFSEDEREKLRTLGLELLDSEDDSLSRELCAVYSAFTVPSETLCVTYPASARRSYIITRLMKLFGVGEIIPGEERLTQAPEMCFELAASSNSDTAASARAYFEEKPEWNGRLEAVRRAASLPRGRISRLTAERLYGRELSLSASRIDKFYSCRFAYFLGYGLKAKPRSQAGLDAPETGTFMHFILERSAGEIERRGGFSKVSDEDIRRIVPEYVREYAGKKLGGLENKSGRFRYLFGRLAQSAVQVVLQMAEELRNSRFVPMDFELSFAKGGDLEPVKVGDGDGAVSINGIVDRVDGYLDGDKLYLRVVDYKTGRKALSLSDIWYGMGLQMLIYLFALQRTGKARYGKEIIPAGVLYTPARDVLTQAAHDLSDEELRREAQKNMRRSGLLIDDPEIIEAMESRDGDTKLLPVRFTKDGTPAGDSLVSLDRFGKLARTIDRLVSEMGEQVRSGSIAADPYFRGQLDNACMYCSYFDACHFSDGSGEDRARYLSRLKTPEFWSKVEEAEK